MKLCCFLSVLFSGYFVFFVFSFNESFNAVNIWLMKHQAGVNETVCEGTTSWWLLF